LRSSGTTFSKRQRERDKREKKQAKAERREQRKHERADRPDGEEPGVDPDIAGIVPGPQPLPPEFD
jgi:hypothetical protein